MRSNTCTQRPIKTTKNHRRMVKERSFSPAHTLTVDVCLSTRRAVLLINVQNMAVFMAVIKWLYSAAALRTVGVRSTRILL